MTGRACRLGLIGIGPWGLKLLAALRAEPQADVVLIASRRPEAAGLAPPGCRIVADWRSLLTDADLDGVVVSVPPPAIPEVAAAALDAGVPAFLEKPVAMTVAVAQALRDRARERGAIVHVNHIDLRNGAWRALTAAAAGVPRPWTATARLGRRLPARTDCPLLWEWGPHPVAMAIDLFGQPPRRVEARMLPPDPPLDAFDPGGGARAELTLGFGDAGSAGLVFGNGMAAMARSVDLSAGGVTLRYDDRAAVKVTRQPEGGIPDYDPTPPLTVAVREFVAAVLRGHPDHGDLELGVAVTAVLAEAERQIAAKAGYPEMP